MWIEYGTAMADRLTARADGLSEYLRWEHGAESLAQLAAARQPARRRKRARAAWAALMQVLGVVGRRKGR